MSRTLTAASTRQRLQDGVRPLLSLRSPVPPILAGVAATIVVIAIVTLAARPSAPTQTNTPLFSPQEIALVAKDMHSTPAAARVVEQGSVRFDNGTWYVRVGDALFHFSQRNQIVVADNDEAMQLEYRR